MFAVRVSRLPLTGFVTCLGRRSQAAKPMIQTYNVTRAQTYSTRSSRAIKRDVLRKDQTKQGSGQTFKERLMAPAGDGAFKLGRGAVAVASGLGIGALCAYGVGLSNGMGTLEQSRLWPEFVRERVRDTYMYFGGGIGVTAAVAAAISKNPRMMSLMSRSGWGAMAVTMAMMIGTNMLCHAIPYQKGTIGAKQLAWLAHAAVCGAVVAPLTLLGGPIIMRAAWMTAGVVGGLSTLAICAPSEKFLNMGGPLACGFGLVLASSVAGMFLPPTTAIGAGLMSISVYGGLILFSGFLLYDTQKIMKKAETHPLNAMQPFDPVNASIGIYADTLNIFIRLAMMLGMGGKKK